MGPPQTGSFGARPAMRRDVDFVARGQFESRQRPARRQIIRFDDKLDVELAARIAPVLWRKRHRGRKVTPDRLNSRHSESPAPRVRCLALQLPFLKVSESMGNHDSKIVDAGSVD